MQDAFAEAVIPGIEVAAEAGAIYYDALGDKAIAEPVEPPPIKALKISARWAMATGDQDTGLSLLLGSAEKYIFNGARDTIVRAVASEKGATWAREASSSACPFCRVLATRGDVFLSAKAAGGDPEVSFHDHCRCLAVPVRPGGRPYRAPSYVEKWEQEYQDARKATGSGDLNTITAWMQANQTS